MLNAETKPTFLFLLYTKQRKFFYRKEWKIEKKQNKKKKRKEGFLTAFVIAIKKVQQHQ